MLLISLPFWGLAIFLLMKSPPANASSWLTHWIFLFFCFGMAGGMVYMGAYVMRSVISTSKQNTPEAVVRWYYEKLLPRLGGSEDFGPPWPLLFSVLTTQSQIPARDAEDRIRQFWCTFYEKNLSQLMLREHPSFKSDPLFAQGGRFTTLRLWIESLETRLVSSYEAIVKCTLFGTTTSGRVSARWILSVTVRKIDDRWFIVSELPQIEDA